MTLPWPRELRAILGKSPRFRSTWLWTIKVRESVMAYDAIIVGARCAGAPTAMLLARRGYKILLLDADRVPSDMPMSTHLIWQSGRGASASLGSTRPHRRE